MKIAHIINPVKVGEHSDLFVAQPITFESMRIAKEFSVQKDNIELCSTQYEEDLSTIPAQFTILSNLNKSIKDIQPGLTEKKLPLIRDVLEKLKEVEAADYYIYSNVDIALMPQFYDCIYSYISEGYDTIIINRRRLQKKYKEVKDLPRMYADLGKSHPGFDCFVFKKELLDKMVLGNICIGVPFIEATLVHNLFSFANKPLFIADAHLTFHIGMEVLNFKKNALYWHNRREFFNTIQPQLQPYYSIKKFPYNSLPIHKRAIKWMLNPSLFTRNYIDLEGKSIYEKIKSLLNEIRWRILQR